MRLRWLVLGIMAVLLFGIAGTGVSYAHTMMTTASPEPDSTVSGELEEVVLTFNTDIDASSTFSLIYEGEELDIGPVEVDEQYMRAAVDRPLSGGKYTVAWQIVGEDGHPIESEYLFTVDAPVLESAPDESVQEEAPAVSEQDGELQDAQQDTAQDSDSENGSSGSVVLPLVIGAAVALVLLLLFVWGTRNGRKK
ncbi:copper resistance protein CopC [Paenibacillus sp. 1P07SE]|uniref:copper resistance CopC family protein n=1 Tax=Paenibacillus sp. 1P07SE TaxID=3132209 RepID=UPI0039A70FD8